MTEKALTEQRNDCLAQMEEIVNAAKSESRALTADEQTAFDECKNKVEAIDKTIKANEVLDMIDNKELTPVVDEVVNKADKEYKDFSDFLHNVQNTNANLTFGDNGAIVPQTIIDRIVSAVSELSPLYAKAEHFNIRGTISIPYVDTTTDDITVGWSTDFTAVDAHANAFDSVDLTGYTFAAQTKISKQLIRNAQFDVVQFVIDRMAEKLAGFFDNILINGASNKAAGIIGSYDDTNMKLTLAKKSSVTSDELIELQGFIPSKYQANCAWIVHPSTLGKLRKLKDGQSNYLLISDFVNNDGLYRLLGRPVYTSDFAPALGTAANAAIIYGDFSGLAVKETGTYEITVDRYTEAAAGAEKVVLNGEIDAKVSNGQKFAVAVCGAAD